LSSLTVTDASNTTGYVAAKAYKFETSYSITDGVKIDQYKIEQDYLPTFVNFQKTDALESHYYLLQTTKHFDGTPYVQYIDYSNTDAEASDAKDMTWEHKSPLNEDIKYSIDAKYIKEGSEGSAPSEVSVPSGANETYGVRLIYALASGYANNANYTIEANKNYQDETNATKFAGKINGYTLSYEAGPGAKILLDALNGIAGLNSTTGDIKIESEGTGTSIKYYLTTTADVEPSATATTLTITKGTGTSAVTVGTISVTIKDYAATIFDGDWHNTSYTIPIESLYKLYNDEALSTEWINSDGKYTFASADEGDNSVWFRQWDAYDNILQTSSHTVKIDKTKPSAPYITYTDINGDEQTATGGTSASPTAITIPTSSKVYLHAADNDGGSGIKEILLNGTTAYSDEEELVITGSPYSFNLQSVDNADLQSENEVYFTVTTADICTVTWTNQVDGATGSFKVFKGEKISETTGQLPVTSGYDAEQYNFLGWNKGSGAYAVKLDLPHTVPSDLNLTGKWQYKVTFDANGKAFDDNGSDVTTSAGWVEHERLANSIAPSKATSLSSCFYIKDLWLYKDADNEFKEWGYLYTDKITAPITLYANWAGSKFEIRKGSNLDFTNIEEAGATSTANANIYNYQYGKTVKFKVPSGYIITKADDGTENLTVTATDRTDASDANTEFTSPITPTLGNDGVYSFDVPCFNYVWGYVRITATTKYKCRMSTANMYSQYEYGKIGGCKVYYTSSYGTDIEIKGDKSQYLTITYQRKVTDDDGNITYEDVANIDEAPVGSYVKNFVYEDDINYGELSKEFEIVQATPRITFTTKNLIYNGENQDLFTVTAPSEVTVLLR